jgi:hypothetical protein
MDEAVTPIGGVDDAVAGGALAIGVLRALVGVAMIAAPRSVVRPEGGVPAPGNLVFMVRTIGVRDLALGLGTVAAARSSRGGAVRRWIQFGLLSDALDVVTGARSSRLLGRAGAATAALVPVPFVAADLLVLRSGG